MRPHVGVHAIVRFDAIAEVKHRFLAGFVGVIKGRNLGNLALNKAQCTVAGQHGTSHRRRAGINRGRIVGADHDRIGGADIRDVRRRFTDVGQGFAAKQVGGDRNRVGFQVARAIHRRPAGLGSVRGHRTNQGLVDGIHDHVAGTGDRDVTHKGQGTGWLFNTEQIGF